jgi:uncharacterized metal-binding protein YceD (DUF177 family)
MDQSEFSRPEFSRTVQLRQVDARPHRLEANEAERKALAKRFGLVAIHRLEAEAELEREGDEVEANGTMEADIVQSCAVTGDDLPVSVREKIAFRFVPEHTPAPSEEEVELEAGELDEIPYSGTSFDLGEAIAQSLALAIDPYATGPNAEAARKEAGLLDEESTGPFAALKGLKTEE